MIIHLLLYNSRFFSTLNIPASQVKTHFLTYEHVSSVGQQPEVEPILGSYSQFLVQRGNCSVQRVL